MLRGAEPDDLRIAQPVQAQPHRLPTEVWLNPTKDSNNLDIDRTNTPD